MSGWRAAVAAGLFAGVLCGEPPLDIFADPLRACVLLTAEGFKGAVWRHTSFGYECASTNLRIDYVVSGDNQVRAKRIKLVLDLRYKSGGLEARRAEFDEIASLLLTRLGLKASARLHGAIKGTYSFREAQAGANLTFDPGRWPFTQQVLIIRDPRIRVAPIPRSP